MTIRFATFNVENLFSRPKAMNLDDTDHGTTILATVAELQDLLDRDTYGPADKRAIADLALAARGYFSINKTRGRTPLSYSRRSGVYTVKVGGKKDWAGFIELTRAKFSDASVANTGKFIGKLNADILGICEVENLSTMRYFRSQHFGREGLRHAILIDATDPRGIDVGLYSRFPFGHLRSNVDYKPDGATWPLFTRDCLEAEIPLGGDRRLHVLQNHLKSKLGPKRRSDARRKAQATRINEILGERYDLTRDWVIVAGDMNDTPGSDPLSPLFDNPGLHDVLEVAGVDPARRWTYHYRSNEQIDHVLVSTALRPHVAAAGVDRSGIAEVADHSGGTERPMAGITGWRNAASDHGAVWVDLSIAG